MSIQATFFTISKRDNSTLKPTSGGQTLDIKLLDVTNVLTPIIEVHYNEAFSFNMCYIDFFSRWYKIRDVESIAKGTYNLFLDVDVLATWKDDLIGQSVHAEYSSYDYNIWLDDTRVTVGSNFDMDVCSHFKPVNFMPDEDYGTPVLMPHLGIVSKTGVLNGIDIVFGADGGRILQDFSDRTLPEIFKSGSPWDAVCEAYYTPYRTQACHETDSNHQVEIWGRDYAGMAVITKASPFNYSDTLSIDVPSNIDFRFADKYVKYYMIVPFSGITTIPTSLVMAYYRATGNEPIANVRYCADDISGQFAAEVSIGNVSLGMFGANLRLDMKLGGRETQQSVMVRQGALGAIGAAGAVIGAHGSAAAIALGAAAGGAAGLFKGSVDVPPVDQFGQFGGNAAMLGLNATMGEFKIIKLEADSNINPATLTSILGRPSMKITTIQNGYIKTAGASVAFAGLAEEIERVNNLLNGGIYVE